MMRTLFVTRPLESLTDNWQTSKHGKEVRGLRVRRFQRKRGNIEKIEDTHRRVSHYLVLFDCVSKGLLPDIIAPIAEFLGVNLEFAFHRQPGCVAIWQYCRLYFDRYARCYLVEVGLDFIGQRRRQ